jgi:hypothetical protein
MSDFGPSLPEIRHLRKARYISSSPTSNTQPNDPADFDFATLSDAVSGTCARG